MRLLNRLALPVLAALVIAACNKNAATDDNGKFTLEDVPAGAYRLQVWHEGYGFIQKGKNDRGIVITITDGKVTEPKIAALKKED